MLCNAEEIARLHKYVKVFLFAVLLQPSLVLGLWTYGCVMPQKTVVKCISVLTRKNSDLQTWRNMHLLIYSVACQSFKTIL